ncbi:MAG: WG repeat-containing protein [Thermoleophilia bacterium]|nr:WG repeat-containing protein [Thermoleophilia bacterium]
MHEEWYVHRDGHQYGPYTWEEIVHQGQIGGITARDLLWSQTLNNWVPADRVAGVPLARPAGDRKTGRRGKTIALAVGSALLVAAAVVASVLVFAKDKDAASGSGVIPETTTVTTAVGLHPIYENGKGAYVDNSGTVVIEPRFEEVGRFSDGLAAVILNGEGAFIDAGGEVAARPPEDAAVRPLFASFSEGLAALPSSTGDVYGYIDTTGTWVVEPRFKEAGPCLEDRACVAIDGRYGYVDGSGALVIEPQFVEAGPFSYKRALVEVEGRFAYIDKTGALVIEPQFDFATTFSEGLAAVATYEESGDYDSGYIDANGDWVIRFPTVRPSSSGEIPPKTPLLNDLSGFAEGFAVAQRWDGGSDSYLTGYLDKTGAWAIEPVFSEAYPFSEGRAVVSTYDEDEGGYAYGYIDRSGNLVIDARYETAAAFSGGIAEVSWHTRGPDSDPPFSLVTKWAYLDADGSVVWGSD